LDTVIVKLTGGCHRGLVQGKGWRSILSQWDLTVFLARRSRELDEENLANNRRNWLGSITNATLGELGLAMPKAVVALPHGVNAMEGFRHLAINGVSAMPIVDDNKDVIGTLSTSDLRGLNAESIKSLSLPVMDFLKVANALQYPQAVVTPKTTLAEALLKIQARDVHRVWVLSPFKKLQGVLSLTDILALFARALMPATDKGDKKATDAPSMSTDTGAMPPKFTKSVMPVNPVMKGGKSESEKEKMEKPQMGGSKMAGECPKCKGECRCEQQFGKCNCTGPCSCGKGKTEKMVPPAAALPGVHG